MNSGLGTGFSPDTGYDGAATEPAFAVGLQGVTADEVDGVSAAVLAALEEVAERGFDRSELEALLHQLELSQKHQGSSFGLHLAMGVMQPWSYGRDPVALLDTDGIVARLRAELEANPEALQQAVREHLCHNPHRSTLVMRPEPEHAERLAAEEAERLATAVAALGDEERAAVAADGLRLLELQDGADGADVLPTLRISDIATAGQEWELEHGSVPGAEGVPLQRTTQPTNGCVYFRAELPAEALSPRMQDHLPLFCTALTRLGTAHADYEALARRIKGSTGGLNAGVNTVRDPDEPERFTAGLSLSSHCLARNAEAMFELWAEVLGSPRWSEEEYLETLIAMGVGSHAPAAPPLPADTRPIAGLGHGGIHPALWPQLRHGGGIVADFGVLGAARAARGADAGDASAAAGPGRPRRGRRDGGPISGDGYHPAALGRAAVLTRNGRALDRGDAGRAGGAGGRTAPWCCCRRPCAAGAGGRGRRRVRHHALCHQLCSAVGAAVMVPYITQTAHNDTGVMPSSRKALTAPVWPGLQPAPRHSSARARTHASRASVGCTITLAERARTLYRYASDRKSISLVSAELSME